MPITTMQGKSGLESRVVRTMFEARKRVFVDLLKWDLPVIDNRYEIDQFDDIHATYLIVTDPTGGHLASARLLPTNRKHILGSMFEELCLGPVPVGSHIYEITRFCLDRSLNREERRDMRNRLVSAIADHAIAHDIKSYTGVAEASWLQQIQEFGWNCMPLGPTKRIGKHHLGALRIDIDTNSLSGLKATGIYVDNEAVITLSRAA